MKSKEDLKKMENLNYVSFKNVDNLDNIEYLIFVDSKDPNGPDVFTKRLSVGEVNVNNKYNIEEICMLFFINCINRTLKEENDIIITNKDIVSTIEESLSSIGNSNNNKFIIIDENIDEELYKDLIDKDYYINKTDKLDNEIIVGYKTNIDMPGIILVSNEDGIKDYNKLRIAVVDIGFFPEKQYRRIKIK